MSSENRQSGLARVFGSGSAGILEICLFHPVDTTSKRLMSNHTRVRSLTQLNSVIFREKCSKPFGERLLSLFPGLGYATSYKVLQRVYKYGGQPFVNEFLDKNFKADFNSAFGEKTGKALRSATAGSLIGIGEIVLLPLDVLKIKKQTNPDALKGRGFVSIMRDEGMGLYKGWSWTAARNAPGSFALFGANAFAKEYVLGLEEYSKASWGENFVSSVFGASASLIVSAPFDVIKTRIQNKSFESTESGFTIIKNTLKNEGIPAFFKGLTPKLLTTGPKLVFSFALAQTLIPLFDNILSK